MMSETPALAESSMGSKKDDLALRPPLQSGAYANDCEPAGRWNSLAAYEVAETR